MGLRNHAKTREGRTHRAAANPPATPNRVVARCRRDLWRIGSQVRSLRLDERAAILDDPYIRGLMAQALKVAGADLKTGSGQVALERGAAGKR